MKHLKLAINKYGYVLLSATVLSGICLINPAMGSFETARMGIAGGDAFQGGMWVQGLYNHSKQDKTASNEKFKANTRGVLVGVDDKLSDALTVGLGYAYTNTSVDAEHRDVDLDGHNVFLYGYYQPSNWYAN